LGRLRLIKAASLGTIWHVADLAIHERRAEKKHARSDRSVPTLAKYINDPRTTEALLQMAMEGEADLAKFESAEAPKQTMEPGTPRSASEFDQRGGMRVSEPANSAGIASTSQPIL